MQLLARAFTLVLVVLALGGCRGSAQPPEVKVGNDRAVIDFRDVVGDRPTRRDVSMGREGYVTFPTGSGHRTVPTTLRFPDGNVKRSFFQINVGMNYAFSLDRDPKHLPTDFEFFLKARDIDQAKAFLREDSAALGLTPDEVQDVTAQGTSVEQGSVWDRLATEVEARATGDGDGSLNLIYMVTIDQYHNEGVDQILKDGVVSVDLTTALTRERLGFRTHYDSADVFSEPGQQLRLALRTPTGRADLPLDSMLSNEEEKRPAITVASGVSSVAELRGSLRRSAAALGIDAEDTGSFLARTGETLQTQELACGNTEVYSCALRLQTSLSTGEEFGASYRLTLTYR